MVILSVKIAQSALNQSLKNNFTFLSKVLLSSENALK
jgi:hypothetical protein